MAAIETLFKITASVAGANAVTSLGQEIAKVSSEGENLSRKFQKVGTALKLFAVGEGVSIFKEWIGGAIETGVQLEEISQKTGVSVEMLGHLKGAAAAGGVSLEDLANGLVKLDKAIIESQNSTSKQAVAFNALGISQDQIKGKSPEQVFLRIADAFTKYKDGAGKTTAALDLFGKAGANLIPVLNEGREKIEALGISIGSDFAEKAHENELAMLKVKTQFEQTGITVANQLLPGLTKIATGFGDNNVAVQLLIYSIKTLETVFVAFESLGSSVLETIGYGFTKVAVEANQLTDIAKSAAMLDFNNIDSINANAASQQDALTKAAEDRSQKLAKEYAETVVAIWQDPKPLKKTEEKDGKKPDVPLSGNAGKNATESESAQKSVEKWLKTQDESNKTLAQEADYLGKTSVEIEILKANRKLDAEAAVKSIGLTDDQKDAFIEEEAAVKKSRDAILQHNYELSRTASTGAVEYLKKYAEAASDSAAQIKNVLGDAFKGVEDVFVNFVQTGKLSFKSMIDSILGDLTRLTVQRSITGPLSSALSSAVSSGGFFSSLFADGGIMTSGGSIPLNKYAGGGIANSAQMAVFGEGRTPEAYVPLPDGRSIPVNLKGGGGNANTVNVVVNMNGSNSSDSMQGMDAKGQALGRTIAAAVKATLIDEKRPGGLLAA